MIRIGVDIGGTKIEVAALDDEDRELVRTRSPTPQSDYQATIAEVARLVNDVLRQVGDRATIGVGMPGAISGATGLVKNANSTVLNGRPFSRDLVRAAGREMRFENDANCFALSEAADGAAKGERVVFGAILGTGVGGGLVFDGEIWVGRNAIAGEWGHNPLPVRRGDRLLGKKCYCGRTDCIETYLSGPALELEYQRETGAQASVGEIVHRADASDGAARKVLERFYERLALALATVVNVLDPDVIVLGGGLSNIDGIFERVPAALRASVFSDVVETRLVRALHGDSSGVRGAARLWPNT